MKHEDIIQWARDADCTHVNLSGDRFIASQRLGRFAELVAAHVRAETAKQVEELQALAASAEKWRGLALAKNGDGRILSEIQREQAEAVAAEREACAKVCEGIRSDNPWDSGAQDCAEAIRARGGVAS